MNYAEEPDPVICRCGGVMFADPSPASGLEFGPPLRRWFCRLCGRDQFRRPGDRLATR